MRGSLLPVTRRADGAPLLIGDRRHQGCALQPRPAGAPFVTCHVGARHGLPETCGRRVRALKAFSPIPVPAPPR
jgi:hypothetical protein